jgi:hypothetical protein
MLIIFAEVNSANAFERDSDWDESSCAVADYLVEGRRQPGALSMFLPELLNDELSITGNRLATATLRMF